MVIEQQQIITTHNLAVLFDQLDLVESLEHDLDDMARRCFTWICRRQQAKCDQWHGRLIMLKNTAYAWRQMIFFLSLIPQRHVQSFLSWAGEHLADQTPGFQRRFAPAFTELARAAEGHAPADHSTPKAHDRLFLGWSKDRHWLLD